MLISDVTYLRLERVGDNLSAYCCDDDINWLKCGEAILSIDDPIQIGIHTIGDNGFEHVDTATLFDYFRVFK